MITASCCAVLASCKGPFEKYDYLDAATVEERLRQIEAQRFEDQSRTPPVPLDAAAAEVVRTIVERKPAASSVALTLEEVRADALANNLDLKVELISPQIAKATVDAEEAKFESTFQGSARRSVSDSATASGLEGTQSTFDAFNLGVAVPLRTGGTAFVEVPFSRSENNNPFSLLNPAYNADLRFSISQPLLRGAWDDATMYSIRVARGEWRITEARTKLEAIRILANADRAYWRLYAAKRELEVRQQQYELAVTQMEQAKRRVTAGTVAEIEITRAESGVAGSLEGIIIAENLVKRYQRDLKRIINRDDLPIASATAIETATQPVIVGLDLDGDVLAAYAVANRMEMLELEVQLAIDASTIDFQKNAALPLATVDYTYNINGLGTSYHRAFDQIPDHSFEDWSLGLNVEIPIGNEAAKARVNRAILSRLQRLATKSQREQAIRQEVFDVLDQLHQNWQRILAARVESVAAGRTYEAERRQFDQGLRTSTDVLDAAARLSDAQSREILALAEYQVTQVDLAFATGTLLGAGRIRWNEQAGNFADETPAKESVPSSEPVNATE